MIHYLLKDLGEGLSGLDFVDRYLGVTRLITRTTDDNIRQRFPISCMQDLTWLKSDYRAAMPDDRFKSLFYFEPISPVEINRVDGRSFNVKRYTTQVRLVGWLNTPKLGITNYCGSEGYFVKKIIQHLALYKGRYEVVQDLSGITDPFAAYDYGENTDIQKLTIHPYTYINLTINIRRDLSINCLDDWENHTVILC